MRISFILRLCFSVIVVFMAYQTGLAQGNDGGGTIKVRKQQLLKKAEYDETDYKVIAIDVYGNPKTESISSFELHYEIKGKRFMFFSPNNKLTPEMLKGLKEIKKATKVWFTKIKGTEADGHLVDLPDFDYMIFPKCENCPKGKKR